MNVEFNDFIERNRKEAEKILSAKDQFSKSLVLIAKTILERNKND